VPLHVLHRIIPAPLHAVHSRGDRLVKPRTLSSFLSRCEIFTGASRLPVPSQKMHVSPPLCAHAGHGSGSPFSPKPTANAPMTAPKPAMEASCAASSSAVDGIALGTPRDAPRRPVGTHVADRRGVLLTRARVSGAAGAARAVQLAIAGIADISERGNAARRRVSTPRALEWHARRQRAVLDEEKIAPLGSQSASTSSGFGGKRDTRVSLDVPLLGATTRDAERLGISFDRA